MKKKWEHFLDGVLLTLVILWTAYILTHSPTEIIDFIGVHNGYLIAFLVALFGGMAIFTFISVYPTIISFSIGGLDPFLLGISAALGLTAANIIFFYLGLEGRDLANEKYREAFDKFMRWLSRAPNWLVPVVIWVYVGLTPMPNNFLTASGGLIQLPLKKLFPPLLLGNLMLMWFFAYGGAKLAESLS